MDPFIPSPDNYWESIKCQYFIMHWTQKGEKGERHTKLLSLEKQLYCSRKAMCCVLHTRFPSHSTVQGYYSPFCMLRKEMKPLVQTHTLSCRLSGFTSTPASRTHALFLTAPCPSERAGERKAKPEVWGQGSGVAEANRREGQRGHRSQDREWFSRTGKQLGKRKQQKAVSGPRTRNVKAEKPP